MTKDQARQEATRRWGTPGIAPTDRVAVVTLRRYGVVNRCEVGWYVRGGRGVPVKAVVEGRGPTWEAAFADADARARDGANHRHPGRDADGEPGNVSE